MIQLLLCMDAGSKCHGKTLVIKRLTNVVTNQYKEIDDVLLLEDRTESFFIMKWLLMLLNKY